MEVKNELYQYLKFPDLKEITVKEVLFYQGMFQKIVFYLKGSSDREYDFRLNISSLKELTFVLEEIIKFSVSDSNIAQVLEQQKSRMLRPEEVDKLVVESNYEKGFEGEERGGL